MIRRHPALACVFGALFLNAAGLLDAQHRIEYGSLSVGVLVLGLILNRMEGE